MDAARGPEATLPGDAGASGAPRSRRRFVRLAIALGVPLLLLLGLGIADAAVRAHVANVAADKVRTVFHVPDSVPVRVDIAGFSVLAQLAAGEFERIGVHVDNLAIGDLRGGVSLHAHGVPTDTSRPVERVRAEFRVPESTVQGLMGLLSASVLNRVELADGHVHIGSEFSVPWVGIHFSLGIALEPFARDGHLGFTPANIEVGGERTTAAELIERYGDIAAAVLETRAFCVAEWLPSSLAIDDASVRARELVVSLSADRALMTDEALSTRGACEPLS